MYKEEAFKAAKDQEWEIGVLLNHYAEHPDRNDSYDKADNIKHLYSRAISLTVGNIGLVYPIDDFIACVKDGSYIDWDGSAHGLDFDGNELDIPVYCNVNVLKQAKEKGAVFIEWCNK